MSVHSKLVELHLMRLAERIKHLIRRRRRAKKLGFRYCRARDFELPERIWIGGSNVAVHAPHQNGMRVAFLDVLVDDCYGLRCHSHRRPGSVLDIGGNVGFFGLAARDAFPQATIHVYEPNPAALPYLAMHARAVGFDVHAEAIGTSDGFVGLTDDSDLVQVRAVPNTGHIPRIGFRTAIERIGGHCDLVKLDCEGAEWEILNDVEPWQNVDHLSMEYHLWHDAHQHQDIRELIRTIGFKVRRQTPVHGDCGIIWASRI